MESINLVVGQEVYVNRKIGKNGIPEKVKGKVVNLSNTITVNGKKTAYVEYEDKKHIGYYYPIDEITPV